MQHPAGDGAPDGDVMGFLLGLGVGGEDVAVIAAPYGDIQVSFAIVVEFEL